MSVDITQDDVDALMAATDSREEYLSHFVMFNGKMYCYDATSGRCVEMVLTPTPHSKVPEEAEKLIAMKRFNLKE